MGRDIKLLKAELFKRNKVVRLTSLTRRKARHRWCPRVQLETALPLVKKSAFNNTERLSNASCRQVTNTCLGYHTTSLPKFRHSHTPTSQTWSHRQGAKVYPLLSTIF
jgi:hypothetical protein